MFQNSYLSAVVDSAGWRIWSADTPNTEFATLAEYGNTGPGSTGTRASFAQKLSAPVTIETVLGSSYSSAWWVDTSYL